MRPRLRQRPRLILFLAAMAGFAATGCSDDGPSAPDGSDESIVRTIDDLDYVKGRYYFLQHPAEQLSTQSVIEPGSVRVFLDDLNGANNQGVREGRAAVDPTRPPAVGDTLGGTFDELRELADFQVKVDYYGDRFPVLVLRTPIASSQMLAVTYEEILPGGSRRTVGSVPDSADEPLVLKLLQAPRQYLEADDMDPDYFESDPAVDPLAVTRELELKSFYDLKATNIDPRSLQIEVHRYEIGPSSGSDGYTEGIATFPYAQILGVDLFTDNGAGAAIEGSDTVVDQFTSAWFLQSESGILFFPDLRPFDPRITPRPDAHPEEDHFFRSRIAVDPGVPGLRGRVLWPPGLSGAPGVAGGGATPPELEANRNPYDRRNLITVRDRRYFIQARFASAAPKSIAANGAAPSSTPGDRP